MAAGRAAGLVPVDGGGQQAAVVGERNDLGIRAGVILPAFRVVRVLRLVLMHLEVGSGADRRVGDAFSPGALDHAIVATAVVGGAFGKPGHVDAGRVGRHGDAHFAAVRLVLRDQLLDKAPERKLEAIDLSLTTTGVFGHRAGDVQRHGDLDILLLEHGGGRNRRRHLFVAGDARQRRRNRDA